MEFLRGIKRLKILKEFFTGMFEQKFFWVNTFILNGIPNTCEEKFHRILRCKHISKEILGGLST